MARLSPNEIELIKLSRRMAMLTNGGSLPTEEGEEEIVTLAFPGIGGLQTIPTGTTRINFYNKDILYGDSTPSTLEQGLQNSPGHHKEIHSIYFYSDQLCKLKLVRENGDSTSWIRVVPDSAIALQKINFQKILVSTEVANTGISLIASTDASAAVSIRLGVAGTGELEGSLETDETAHFTGALNTGVREEENLAGLAGHVITITGVSATSVQGLHYELVFFSTNAFDYTHFLGAVDLDFATYGRLYDGRYYLDLTQLGFKYKDASAAGELHVALLNLDAAAKNAGATGYIQARFKYNVGK